MASLDSFKSRQTLEAGGKTYTYYSIPEAQQNGLADAASLPFSMKVLLENLLRFEDDRSVRKADVEAAVAWLGNRGKTETEIAFRPSRVLMQDFTGVPAVVDLAAMRDAMVNLGGDPQKINPLVPVDLVIDHSVIVDEFGTPKALDENVALEYARNGERYTFLKWGQSAFDNFSVVPPGTGICHQVNLEYLSQTVWTKSEDGAEIAYPDSLVGTDSHTTMVNGLAVLGWGVGGIEAEAAMLGQPLSMLIPEVVGFKLSGKLPEGTTATDLVLTVTQMLRKKGVVGKFVEFYGPGLDDMPVADRATISNMAPEYGATCGFFPVDQKTIDFLKVTGRADDRIALVEAYAKAQGMWRDADTPDPVFTDTLELDMGDVQPSLAGPKRPQDRVLLADAKTGFAASMESEFKRAADIASRYAVEGTNYDIGHGDVVIAAITSCTNTSNPSVMIGAGLLARNAVAKGLTSKPWVKTSLAPGSQVVAEYLEKAGLQKPLDQLGFNLVGFGCTTCIGNSGPLPAPISKAINDNDVVAAAVLSGNRNFEGRVNPDVRANYLASPPLVVAYALAGSLQVDLTKEPLGKGSDGQPVYLRDIWPSSAEVAAFIEQNITSELFKSRYADVFGGDQNWRDVEVTEAETFAWNGGSTYVQNPPYFVGMEKTPAPVTDIEGARILGLFLDSITTDHISPAGNIRAASPAGEYLQSHQVRVQDFNQYGTRRGNHEVMMRGTFANIRIKNQMVKDAAGNVVEGGWTHFQPTGEKMFIYDAAQKYAEAGTPLVIFAGKEYGTGSSRDWAAKGTKLLGVRAVVAESFERIHRSNLVGMGVVPLVFQGDTSWQSLGLKGDETVTIKGLAGELKPRQTLTAEITSADGSVKEVPLTCRIDTLDELEYFRNGGILPYVLRSLAA
ncbi:aconitate hydratase AcnA [Methylobacterium gregans]|uniref:Aconitate hydratase n=2 Tax=Methylobacterium gregans TaxID=374424 RepID=A0AA37HK80_9HYPH|nr:aconitate hydratase AcnA [Methylobacterium gregans]MDQ0518773.1 aconitate hydratase [Methylobacterium gregans]GJD77344.1 Aconitate hydratase A [Methylobacterium gregans]GLS56471.1 aconitate hydratase [Methylobacterium gregans]